MATYRHEVPRENINIAEDGKIDLRFIAWIKVGTVKLAKGAHSIKFKMHSDNNNHGMLDCFVFADGPFTPEGKRKPGEKSDAREVAVNRGPLGVPAAARRL